MLLNYLNELWATVIFVVQKYSLRHAFAAENEIVKLIRDQDKIPAKAISP